MDLVSITSRRGSVYRSVTTRGYSPTCKCLALPSSVPLGHWTLHPPFVGGALVMLHHALAGKIIVACCSVPPYHVPRREHMMGYSPLRDR